MKRILAVLGAVALLFGVSLSSAQANLISSYSPYYTTGWNHQYTDRVFEQVAWHPQADGQGVTIDFIVDNSEDVHDAPATCDNTYSSIDYDSIKIKNGNGTVLKTWTPNNADCDWSVGVDNGLDFTVNTNCATVVTVTRPHVKDNPDPGPFTISRTVCD